MLEKECVKPKLKFSPQFRFFFCRSTWNISDAASFIRFRLISPTKLAKHSIRAEFVSTSIISVFGEGKEIVVSSSIRVWNTCEVNEIAHNCFFCFDEYSSFFSAESSYRVSLLHDASSISDSCVMFFANSFFCCC